MIDALPPGLILILGAVLVPVLRGPLRQAYMLALPILGLWALYSMAPGSYVTFQLLGHELTLLRIDPLAKVFGTIFHIAALISIIYALHVKDTMQHVAALIYSGAAIGAVFVGDMISLFVFWELTAISSVFLIWASRTERAYRAGMRYLIVQVSSGVILLGGIVLHVHDTGSVAFDFIGLNSFASWLILIAFGIKCAFPFLHNWLQDAYPEATVTGTVVLSAFTTKLAVYALARSFPGTEILIPIGAAMTAFPIFYAVLENDLRKVLSYSLNNQLGFMVVGIGIGTELSINGTASHAFSHILYKSLLFMSMGAVLFRTGTIKASELGGLYKSMPLTAIFCIIGSVSISAFPLTNGFISKSMVLSGAMEQGYIVAWAIMLFASAGVLDHSGIKVPFFSFFAHDSGIRVKEAPLNMLIAMGITAFLCIATGIYPDPLYAMLPYPVDYHPYGTTHVVTQLQLLMFSVLAFAVLMRLGIYPPELKSVNVDFDWVYRKALPGVFLGLGRGIETVRAAVVGAGVAGVRRVIDGAYRLHGPAGVLARSWSTGGSVLLVVAIFGLTLLVYYL